ncbi:predicted protein [Nematostella vectensis]|uniref:Uncharacterized protein n=1 Tax=Nematostella vectensis TaxID=45351 RepID=A7SG31_NEMVE|nr:predicted protein [Nematostella vectensis]|eukprot:XP_001629372.1 predicted protein [Nematostella vectensis]
MSKCGIGERTGTGCGSITVKGKTISEFCALSECRRDVATHLEMVKLRGENVSSEKKTGTAEGRRQRLTMQNGHHSLLGNLEVTTRSSDEEKRRIHVDLGGSVLHDASLQKARFIKGNSASVDLPYTTSLETTIDYLNSIPGNPIDPTKLLDLLGFDGYTKGQQHDVHGAFTAIMVKLRDEKSYSAREFEGNITYAYKCVACNAQERLNSDIFDCITAEIAEKGEGIAIGTKDCVEEFWNEETLGTENKVICHKCNLKTTHRKSMLYLRILEIWLCA